MMMMPVIMNVAPGATFDHSVCTLQKVWPLVRVIWGRGLGSTYQRVASPVEGASVFSRPLNCPGCGGLLELQQSDKGHPDRLVGSCGGCLSRFHLEVGEKGKVSSVEPEGVEGSREGTADAR